MGRFSYQSGMNPVYFAVSLFSLMISRVLFFTFSAYQDLIGVIPDDAFYYIQMAMHRAKEGRWTFDGATPATGFHFLYGYLLALIFLIYPKISWIDLFVVIGIISSLAISFSSYLITKTINNLYQDREELLLVGTLPFLSFYGIIQCTSMMESWLVILFSSLTIFSVFSEKALSYKYSIWLFVIGLSGSLSRADYGMLPGALFFAVLIIKKLKWTSINSKAFIVLLGAVTGVLLVLIQNFYISGHLTQASAQTKFYWSSVYGHSIIPSLALFSSLILPKYLFTNWLSKIIVFSFLLIYFIWRLYLVNFIKTIRLEENEYRVALLVGSLLTIIGYILFYKYNSAAIQPWYSANLIAPISIFGAGLFYFIITQRKNFVIILLFFMYLYSCIKTLFVIPFPHQLGMMNAGIYVQKIEGEARYASWNAGIIGYFSQKKLINIDGLTNDEVLVYIKSNRLLDYIKSHHVDFIIDYKAMIDDKLLRLRGGYDDDRAFKCILPIREIDGNASPWGDSRLMLFKVIPDCL